MREMQPDRRAGALCRWGGADGVEPLSSRGETKVAPRRAPAIGSTRTWCCGRRGTRRTRSERLRALEGAGLEPCREAVHSLEELVTATESIQTGWILPKIRTLRQNSHAAQAAPRPRKRGPALYPVPGESRYECPPNGLVARSCSDWCPEPATELDLDTCRHHALLPASSGKPSTQGSLSSSGYPASPLRCMEV